MTHKINNVKKILGFDLDGVIVDHTETKIKLAKKKGFALKKEDTPSDVIKSLIPEGLMRDIQHELYSKNSDQPLIDGSLKTLKKIKSGGIKYYLISRRHEGAAREMAVMIMKKRGLWPEIFNEQNVFFVNSPEEKNSTAESLAITHYVDDEENVLNKMTFVEGRILFDNFNTKKETPYKKVSSWEEISKIIF